MPLISGVRRTKHNNFAAYKRRSRLGVKYVGMYDSCRSQVSQCMTLAGVMYVSMYDTCRSQVSQCMTPAGVKYVMMYDSCRSQVYPYV